MLLKPSSLKSSLTSGTVSDTEKAEIEKVILHQIKLYQSVLADVIWAPLFENSEVTIPTINF